MKLSFLGTYIHLLHYKLILQNANELCIELCTENWNFKNVNQ